MTATQQQQIKDAHFELPEDCRYTAASAEELDDFESDFGAIPSDYRWYLAECGGGVIGCEWIDGIEELTSTHRKVQEGQRRGFYRIPRFFPLGWDGAGNPSGYNQETGHIVTEDHDSGGIYDLASDFYSLLCKKGLIK